MIRYSISENALRAHIVAVDANWFAKTTAALAALPTPPASSDFRRLWSIVKEVYIDLQHSKCCFCEKPLEGKIEQDVEHYRPKTEVKQWRIPKRLTTLGVTAQQPANGDSEIGYAQLAYNPFNYAMACKTCNSTLKRDLFPIEGVRDSAGNNPSHMAGENALLIYPIGDIDVDPEDLIEFIGLSPVPKHGGAFERRRAFVTIEIFKLDDNKKRRPLFKQRAYLLKLLFLELDGLAKTAVPMRRQRHQAAIDALTSSQAPFTNCMRSFVRLYNSDPQRAELIADECQDFIEGKSI